MFTSPIRGMLLFIASSLSSSHTGLSPAMAGHSIPLLLDSRVLRTTYAMFCMAFGLVFPAFTHRYWPDTCWFLFVPLLRCFISGANYTSLRMCAAVFPDRRLRAATRNFSQLTARPCFSQPSHPLCSCSKHISLLYCFHLFGSTFYALLRTHEHLM
jgi:hypothetical protein